MANKKYQGDYQTIALHPGDEEIQERQAVALESIAASLRVLADDVVERRERDYEGGERRRLFAAYDGAYQRMDALAGTEDYQEAERAAQQALANLDAHRKAFPGVREETSR